MCSVASVVSDSLRLHGPYAARLLCPWGCPGNNARVGGHALLQEIFLTQGLYLLRFLHCRRILYHWATKEIIRQLTVVMQWSPFKMPRDNSFKLSTRKSIAPFQKNCFCVFVFIFFFFFPLRTFSSAFLSRVLWHFGQNNSWHVGCFPTYPPGPSHTPWQPCLQTLMPVRHFVIVTTQAVHISKWIS